MEQALLIEIDSFLSQYVELRDDSSRERFTRTGNLPERQIQTGIGHVPVKIPRVRDRKQDYASEGIRFNSSISPPYLRKTRSIESLILYNYT